MGGWGFSLIDVSYFSKSAHSIEKQNIAAMKPIDLFGMDGHFWMLLTYMWVKVKRVKLIGDIVFVLFKMELKLLFSK